MAFNVNVKSEPRGTAKGQFKCEVYDDGVTLSQRSKEIVIPVGSDVAYSGKNRLEARLPDYRLDMQVTKFGTYQNRLAKSLAEFLAGRGNPPVVTDFTLPWYFYLVSLLPIGIPILTLGGALPAVIGFGLCSACFAICQKEDWSTPVRLLLAGAVVALGYLVLFAVMAIAVISRQAP